MLAAVVYAVMWVIDRRAKPRQDPGGGSSPARPPAPRGPDDDEDFLRDLDWRRARDEKRRTTDPDPQSDTDNS